MVQMAKFRISAPSSLFLNGPRRYTHSRQNSLASDSISSWKFIVSPSWNIPPPVQQRAGQLPCDCGDEACTVPLTPKRIEPAIYSCLLAKHPRYAKNDASIMYNALEGSY